MRVLFAYPVAPNLLDRKFTPSAPSMVWVSDITYIYTLSGFIYLTTVIDLYDRKVIGWSISSDMTKEETVIKAFNMAKNNRAITEECYSTLTEGRNMPAMILLNCLKLIN